MASTGTTSFRIASAFRGGPIRWLILGGTLLIAAIAIGATIMAGNFRERALRSSERELENTVLLLARHFDQQLEDFQVVQKDLIAFMRSSGIATPENYKRRMSGHDIHLMLKSKIEALSYVGGINVFDAEGNLINASAAWPAPPVNSADRAFFRTFKSDPQSPEMLVEPVYSRITGAWTTVIARKVTGPKGEFLGAIGRGIEPVNFEKFFATVALGPGATIAMHHSDGTLLARYPHVAELIGKNFKTGPAAQRQIFELPRTTSRLISPIDGEDRLISSRALTNFPLVIIASTTTSAALADWREQIEILITITGLSVLAIAALLFLVVRKLSHQHRASKQRLSLEKQRLDTAVNNMTQGLLLFDAKQHLIICNRRYLEMYGLSADVVKPGCSFREVIAHRKETGSFVGDIDHYLEVVLREISHRNVMVISTPDGRSIQVVNEPVPDGGWLATHEDITERRRAEERITHLAHYDALTDLPNRALFHERLKRELSHAAPDRPLAVLYIDIDEFKSVNDSLGHMIGDELLKSVAASLAGCARKTDFVARLGGDEFAIVQTGIEDTDDVMKLVSRIFEAIRSPYQCLGHQVTTDASIGIALAPQDGSDIDQILKNADLAMYAAKAAGRRTYRFFETDMEAEVRARRSLEMDLRQALVDGGFEVYYQPCLDLQTNAITGCEALVRWRHPQRGMISPAEFVPLAEDTGLINQLGEWVLTTGLQGSRELARQYQARGQRLAGSIQERHAGAEGDGGAGRIRPRRKPAGARDHRGRAHPRRRGGARRSARPSRHRGPHRARRFRHRLFLAELSAAFSVRQDQDRPLLHHRHRRAGRLVLHRAGGGEHRRRTPHDDDGRRRRDRAATRLAARTRLFGNAGLPVQPAEAGGRYQAAAVCGPAGTRRGAAEPGAQTQAGGADGVKYRAHVGAAL